MCPSALSLEVTLFECWVDVLVLVHAQLSFDTNLNLLPVECKAKKKMKREFSRTKNVGDPGSLYSRSGVPHHMQVTTTWSLR